MNAPHASSSDDAANTLLAFIRTIGQNLRHAGGGDVSIVQIKTLYLISGSDLPTMKDISRQLGVTPPSATSLINKFVREGYIKRMLNVRDRRTINLKLTPKGRQKLEACTAAMASKTNELMQVLTKEEKRQLAAIMKKIIDQEN